MDNKTEYDYRITVDIDTTYVVTDGGSLPDLIAAIEEALEERVLNAYEFEVTGADLPATTEGEPEWLIWSHEHSLWWAPDGCGYRSDLAAAGRYTRAAAEHACSLRSWPDAESPPEVMVLAPPAEMYGSPDLSTFMLGRVNAATAEAVALRAARKAEVVPWDGTAELHAEALAYVENELSEEASGAAALRARVAELEQRVADRDRIRRDWMKMQAARDGHADRMIDEITRLRTRVAELEQALHETANLAATTPVDEHAIAIDNLGEIVRRAQQAIRDRWRVSASEQVSADGKERCGRMWLIDLGPHRFCRGTLRYHFCGGRALHPEQCHCVECGAPFQERRTDPEPRPVTDWGPPPESPSTEER